MNRLLLTVLALVAATGLWAGRPIDALLERMSPGLSEKMEIIIETADSDYFELVAGKAKPTIKANNTISAAVGINWYLKYNCGRHVCWNNLRPELPDALPAIAKNERHSTTLALRYYLNYCTHSYSMAFWDWERWEKEIDWMALHGINMPLAVTGSEPLWRNVLRTLGYPEEKITDFVAGPGFQAWWLMNNLEGWGGPNPDAYYVRQEALQKKIVARMRELGIEPVFAGYSGMVPHDAASTIGLDVAESGKWMSYMRPAFLQPSSKDFARVAKVYYDELEKLYGKTKYYSMDPFHEGAKAKGVDIAAAGKTIMKAMKDANPQAVWVIQGWRSNPRLDMIEGLEKGDLLALDLHAETEPIWNGRGFAGHDWLFCMLHNFGGNIGLYGRINTLADDLGNAAEASPQLKGIGLTPEGIETNPVVYELMCELPWRGGHVDADSWVSAYARARYGHTTDKVEKAWSLLQNSLYNCPRGNTQQGTLESLFCARPADKVVKASAWAQPKPYYDHADVLAAARLFVDQAKLFKGCKNYEYDMVDVVRQVVADKARDVAAQFGAAATAGDSTAYALQSRRFLALLDLQDRLLGTVPDFRLGTWLQAARNCSKDPAEKDRFEWNARVQITTWGNRAAADRGKLHDYAHREWQGLLADFYRPRWQKWFDSRLANWGKDVKIDFYAEEEPWTLQKNHYSPDPVGDPATVAAEVLDAAIKI